MSAECSNGIFMATDTDIQEFEVEGFNSQATVSMTMFREFDEYIWSLEASNGSLKVLLPSAPAVGYHIKGSASLGDIKIGLTGITYILNEKSNAEVQSFNYSSAAQHVKLMLSTSNGPLIVG
jgi:predicted membrane protein